MSTHSATHEQLYAAAHASLARRPQAILREMYERNGVVPTQAAVRHGRNELEANSKHKQAQLQLRFEQLQSRYEAVVQKYNDRISGSDTEQSE